MLMLFSHRAETVNLFYSSSTKILSYNLCCSGKAVSITYCERVFCIHRYPARSAHAPCCNLCLARVYSIFQHCLINVRILGKKLLKVQCAFQFSLQLLSETFLILRRTERDITKMCIGFHVKYSLLFPNFNEN